MIYSMTGYAVVTKELPSGSLNLELRSVNNRYLDIQFRLPDELRLLEAAMRELLTARLNRGKIDCRLSFFRYAGEEDPQQINANLLQKLLELDRTIRVALPEARGLEVADILRWPGILGAGSLPTQDLRDPCMELLHAALDEFAAARAREGEKLKAVLLERLDRMRRLTAEISPRIPALLMAFQEKVRSRLQEAMINHDDDRIRQELSLFASKIDVDEELSRLQTHLDEVERVLSSGGAIGKRMDFLMQELNREANTIGSKSVDAEVSRVSMELKVLIEQMREQVQNIE
ncbi:TIGR00255 family protein [Nitrosospira sp. Nl5]|uniref:YicC/YloC family endoribonuclease n=1 Tax=Nitrosospira sp. Nl5 TaxID=200120 RepID=UPI0008926541|nr:YicC/YloC family endoribonuclease [Nitrosospira sp. Nl5]SCY58117.1 TIGR00255 family protein [Nitrosospira sp. Nl5]